MSKMGQELEKRLDENKYELYKTLDELVVLIEDYIDGNYDINSLTLQPAQRVLAKVEGKQQ